MKINNDNVSKTPDSDASSRLMEKMLHIRNKQKVINNRASTSDDIVRTPIVDDDAHAIDHETDKIMDEVAEVTEVDEVAEVAEVAEETEVAVTDTDLGNPITLSNEEYEKLLTAAKASGYVPSNVHTESISNDAVDNRKKWFMMGAGSGALLVIVAFGIGQIFAYQSRLHAPTKETLVTMQSSADSKNTKESTTSTDIKSDDPQKAIKEELEAVAKATEQPYKISTSEIGGNYILGAITYYPDDSEKTYVDYSIIAPEKPLVPDNDIEAHKIEYKLQTSLPTINKTITVIDPYKVMMATYKQNDSYNTILLYDGKPFGYVTTDKDGNMVNTVTTYYIQNVQQK